MKKSTLLSQPTPVNELRYDDLDSDNEEIQLKYDKFNARKLHSFRRESKAIA